jgi:hypothetical protein
VIEGTHYVEAEWKTVTVISTVRRPGIENLKMQRTVCGAQSTYRDDPGE